VDDWPTLLGESDAEQNPSITEEVLAGGQQPKVVALVMSSGERPGNTMSKSKGVRTGTGRRLN